MIITAMLGGRRVQISAPGPGELDAFDPPRLPTGLYGLDVESHWMGDAGPWTPGWKVRTVQLAPDDDSALVLRMDDPDQREIARSVLANPGNTFASHTKIDPHAVWIELGEDIAARSIDTQVLSVMCAPDDVPGQAKLKPVAARHGMPELGQSQAELEEGLFDRLYREAHPEIGRRAVKAAVRDSHGFNTVDLADSTFVRYAGLDAITARRLVPVLARESKAPSSVLTTERFLTEEAIRLERRGHLVDLAYLEDIAAGAQETEELAAEVVKFHTGLNTTQGQKLVAYFGENGANWANHPKTDKGAPSLAKDNVLLLRDYPLTSGARDVAEAYIRHAKVVDKLKRTKEVRTAMDPRGFVHPTLYTVGTVTSRMSASAPNMQNFSKKDPVMRGMFIPEPGYVLMSCDFAQIELRVVAALAGERLMINTILAGGDLHQLTADLLGITRQEAKTVNFLIVYGGGGARLAAQLREYGGTRSVAECKEIVRTYWQQYPAISALNDYMSRQNGLRLISGRYVPTGRTKDGGSRAYANMNYLIQGSARELLVGAWRAFTRDVATRRLDAQVWFPVHDELVIQARKEHAAEVATIINTRMSFDFYGVPVAADADILLDRNGDSRWMTGDLAKEIRLELAA